MDKTSIQNVSFLRWGGLDHQSLVLVRNKQLKNQNIYLTAFVCRSREFDDVCNISSDLNLTITRNNDVLETQLSFYGLVWCHPHTMVRWPSPPGT